VKESADKDEAQMRPITVWLVLCVAAVAALFPLVCAGGTYHIGRDAGGVYMETDQDGSWYVDPGHVEHFSPGETGRYSIAADDQGTFITTSKGGKYYIDRKALQRLETEREAFNRQQRQSGETETRVALLDDAHVLVPVTLGYRGTEIEVQLLLDTGASITVLHQEVADRLMLKSTRKARLMMADGRLLESGIVKLDFAAAGPITRKGLQASVIRHEGPQVPYQGLLGMNFLKGLDYRVDSKKQTIRWEAGF
jgi:clan AA aspartic protease (TIGR02281 family)